MIEKHLIMNCSWMIFEKVRSQKNSASYRRGSFFCKLAMHPALQISKNRNLFELLQLRWNFLRKPTRNYPDYFQKRTYISAVARSLMLLRPPKIFLLLYSVCEKTFSIERRKKSESKFCSLLAGSNCHIRALLMMIRYTISFIITEL